MIAKKKSRLTREARRQQLLDIGRAVFAERGFDAAALEEIADRAGVSRPIVYDHFGDKRGIFEAVVRGEMARVEDEVTGAIAAPGEPREVLERGLRAFFSYVRENPEGHAVLTRDVPVGLSGVAAEAGVTLDALTSRVTLVIEAISQHRGLETSTAPIFASALIGLGAHVGRWLRDHPEVDLDTVTHATTALVWSGFSGLLEGER